MSRSLVFGAILGALVTAVVVVTLDRFLGEASEGGILAGTSSPDSARLERLDDRLRALELRMWALESRPERMVDAAVVSDPAARAPISAPRGPETADGGMSAVEYLHRYVASFEESETGSEYFRLVVDAFAGSLVPEILALVADGNRPDALTRALVRMLGTDRFRSRLDIARGLLDRLRLAEGDGTCLAAIEALGVIGDRVVAGLIEDDVLDEKFEPFRRRLLDTMVALFGEEANRAIGRLLDRSPGAADAGRLFVLLAANDLPTALTVYRRVHAFEREVRLVAARHVGEFRTDPFRAFVAEWIGMEPDQEVRTILGQAAENQNRVPGWSAKKAVGPPDTENPRQDSPTAWASREPDAGMEWIELCFSPPRRADGLRIHEVNAAGAIVEIVAKSADGQSQSVWKGRDPTREPGVFEPRFAVTSFEVSSIRIHLDTRLVSGWNEIDAVELLGPGGRAFASEASASSSYADRPTVEIPLLKGSWRSR